MSPETRVLNCLVVDDEAPAHEVMKSHLAKIEQAELVGQCYNGTEAYQFLQTRAVDVIFLDIDLPELNGVELLRSVPIRPAVVLTTAHTSFALEGYELGVVDYLLKPIGFPRFLSAFNKVLARVSGASALPAAPSHVTVRADGLPRQVALADLHYLEGKGNYVRLHLPESKLVVLQTMRQWEESLPAAQFCRAHKSFIVNLNHVARLEGDEVVLTNGSRIPLGRKFAALLADRLRTQRG
ncbi:response regulator transcription factor [Hymenobacter sp. BT664]|uniref:Response regulator transcription factor n=2 Tax=Hymenobacter montanus TaxID=2771359 RepID=A0A927BCZ7_9BACT|nr:response regulator transcription factor [Hymenobacter montanus]